MSTINSSGLKQKGHSHGPAELINPLAGRFNKSLAVMSIKPVTFWIVEGNYFLIAGPSYHTGEIITSQKLVSRDRRGVWHADVYHFNCDEFQTLNAVVVTSYSRQTTV